MRPKETSSAGFSIDSIAAQIQSIIGLDTWWRASGYVETNNNQLALNISLDRASEYKRIAINKTYSEIDELFSSAARSIYEVIDPYVAVMSLAANDPTRAIELARQIIATNPPRDINVALAHILIGIIQKGQGKLDAAINEYRRALAIEPNNAAYNDALERALADRPSQAPPAAQTPDHTAPTPPQSP